MVNALTLLAATLLLGASPPDSLVRHGGFDRAAGWNLGPARLVEEGHSGPGLRFDRQGGASQEVYVGRGATFTVACDLRTENVLPAPGGSGYAFAAVYQTDENGRLVAHHDFAQIGDTRPWQRFSYTFQVDPRADTISLRCGLFQATGTAWFDNWTLVAGTVARRLDEVRQPAAPASGGPVRVALLNQPDLPSPGSPSNPETLAAILHDASTETALLSADELADPTSFHAGRFDLVVVPTARAFPTAARRNFVEFLRRGGAMLTCGGYAFDDQVRKVDGRWQSETDVVEQARRLATSRERSLLSDGGFEHTDTLPVGGVVPDSTWRRSGQPGRIVTDRPHEGKHCVEVTVPPQQAGAQCYLDFKPSPGTTYEASGWMRTGQLVGEGMAYMAVYQYDADDRLVEFRDFAVVRESKDWHEHRYSFTPAPEVTRISLRFGLYNCSGQAWFDDFRLGDVTGVRFVAMNTSTGRPADGLEVLPAQIGIFDPSYPLKRACRLRTAQGQHIADVSIDREGRLEGWAACGVVGSDGARWIPILETSDRYGRPRGPAAAVLLHYNGFYAGSAWAFFGLENVDLFADPGGPEASLLKQLVHFLTRRSYLHNLETDVRLYRGDEPVQLSVIAENGLQRARKLSVRFQLYRGHEEAPIATELVRADVAAGANETLRAVFRDFDRSGDLYRVTATLLEDDQPIDETTTGLVLEQPQTVAAGPPLRFRDNYFTLRDQPVFLFGSDTYSRTYRTACENPWTWAQELDAARSIGLNLYENLQYTNPGHIMGDADWRTFSAMNHLVQKTGLVFMPGMLIGHNVAIGREELARQSALCAAYAQRFADTPGLLYYINGDYQMRLDEHPKDVRRLWNEWLASRYGSAHKLREAWGAAAADQTWGNIAFPPPNSGRWDDVAAADRLRFQTELCRRWNEAHVAAVRRHDPNHPITSEYYQHPFAGMDLVMTIDGQDVSNFGYFDRPLVDIARLPSRIAFNDLRARGKGVSLGEYGVKTHPAWSVENGGTHYHIVRTEEEQKRLFMAVAHYGLGMGVSKVQNWCLRDAQTRVFPWGLFYPNEVVPKDVAFVHRNQSILWRFFRPRYVAPSLFVCLPDQLRLGNQDQLGRDVAYRTFDDLFALHYPFGTIDDDNLAELPPEAKVLILPSPFALRDEAFDQLLQWVRRGGTLLVTGDFTYDEDRRRTRTGRLTELAGVKYKSECYPNIERDRGPEASVAFELPGLKQETLKPCIEIRLAGAKALGQTTEGKPVLVRHRVCEGVCWFLTDPLQLDSSDAAPARRRKILGAILQAGTKLAALPVHPDADWLYVMEQPTRRGRLHVVYNTKQENGTEPVQIETAAGPVTLATRNGWPALAATTDDGAIVMASAAGEARLADSPLFSGTGMKALLALDGKDLRHSDMLLVAPFESGSLRAPTRPGPWTALCGDFNQGQWRTLEQVAPTDDRSLTIDADRATCLILLCRPQQTTAATTLLTNVLQKPDSANGF